MSDSNNHDTPKSEKPDFVVGWSAAAGIAQRSASWLRRRVAEGTLRSDRDAEAQHTFLRADLEALQPPKEPSPPLPREQSVPEAADCQREGGPSGAAALPAATAAATAPAMAEGELQALVFDDLEQGRRIAQIVIERRLPRADVARIVEEWRKAGIADLNSPGVPAEVEKLQQRVGGLKEQLDAMTTANGQFAKRLDQFVKAHNDARLFLLDLERRLSRIPFLTRSGVACPECGKVGWLPRQVMCTACGKDHFFDVSDPDAAGRRHVRTIRIHGDDPEEPERSEDSAGPAVTS
ncbi:MAG: hypothetical protein JXB32_06210 [Deltaproteobacteria bacterium]|nr:hypothetical protein [Deltaproteobacteria bacterium]